MGFNHEWIQFSGISVEFQGEEGQSKKRVAIFIESRGGEEEGQRRKIRRRLLEKRRRRRKEEKKQI